MRPVTSIILAVAVAALLAGPAEAGCWRNGIEYPEGAQIGGFTCRGGSWEP